MKSLLFYSDNSDQELYSGTTIHLEKQIIKLSAATIASSPEKPNEDAFAVAYQDNVIFAGIFDGTTSLKQIKSLGEQTGARFASHFLKNKFNQASEDSSPKKFLLNLNRQLLEKSSRFEEATMKDTHTLPSSTATIIKIDYEKNNLSFAHVGDSLGIVYFKNGHSKIVTNNTNNKFDTKMFSLIAKIAKENAITPRIARQDERFKQALVKMFIERNNKPDGSGSGVINGDSNVEQYIQSESIPLNDIKTILLATDGLLPQGWSEYNEHNRQKLLKEIQTRGFQKLFKIKKQSEDNDPDWNYIRYKHSDDATGILIEV